MAIKKSKELRTGVCNNLDEGIKNQDKSNTSKGGPKPKYKPKTKGQHGSGMHGNSNKTTTYRVGKRAIPNIKVTEKNVLEYIIGQDKQVRQILTGIYRSIHFESIKTNLLVIGSSGTGKTATIEQIAKILNIPYTIEDATKYTQEGYYGADVNDMLYNLLDNADQDVEKAQRGIIVIDEIDKKAGHQENDVAGAEVLKSLLKIIEGTTIKLPSLEENEDDPFAQEFIDFDTRNIIIIFSGAFSGLEKIQNERLNTNGMGFKTTEDTSKQKTKEKKVLKQDLIKYGMPEEFVGRVDTIVEMNKLTKEDLSLILKKSKLSIFRRYQNELRERGIQLSYNGELFEIIANASLALDTGARELSNTVNYIFENIIYDLLSSTKKYTKCILNSGIVDDNIKYKLV